MASSFCQVNENNDSIKDFKLDSSKFYVAPININSIKSDFCPTILDNHIIFVSGRDFQYGVVYTNNNKEELLDLYESEKIDSLTFKQPKPLAKTINSKFNDGPACFNKQNTLMIFTSNSKIKPEKKIDEVNQKNLQLFLSEKKDNTWTDPELINFCKPEFNYCHPFLASDQNTLFFSSNIPDGYGGMDLYSSKLENNVWSEPVNLGSTINSSYNEVFPYISDDNILYYSSNDSLGFGGLDIYSFDLNDLNNSKKHLLEKPLNSYFDDFGVFVESNGKKGYFSSNRNKGNKDDIFYFCDYYPYFNNCTKFIKPSYCYTFFEENTLQHDDTLGLVYEWNLGDGTKIKGLEAKHCFMKPGNYLIELNIVEKTSDSIFYNETSYEFNIEDSEQVYINCSDTVIINSPVLISSNNSKIPGYTIEKFYWEFGDGNYSIGNAGYHNYKNKGNFIIHLGVIAKNDSSEQIKNLCIEKNVFVTDSTWVKSKEIKYIEPLNIKKLFSAKNVDSLNFKVYLGSSEFKIPIDSKIFNNVPDINEFEKDSLYNYTSGKKNKPQELVQNYKVAKESGFNNAVVLGFSGDSILPNHEKQLNKKKNFIKDLFTKKEVNQERQRNIYFDSEKYLVNQKYFSTLDSISKILKKRNSMYFSAIYSYTDTTGQKDYNLKLSLKRANSVKRYLVKNGVDPRLIHLNPMGENAQSHHEESSDIEKNRRVTIFIIKKKEK